VFYTVGLVVMGASMRKGSILSFTDNDKEVVVVLRDLRLEFCVFGERVIDEGGRPGGSGISEHLDKVRWRVN